MGLFKLPNIFRRKVVSGIPDIACVPSMPSNIRSWDTSTKPYEVQIICYRWGKYSKQLVNLPQWKHYRYYNTHQGASDALRDLRRSPYHNKRVDYPGSNSEARFPHIKPTLSLYRFKVIKRDIP